MGFTCYPATITRPDTAKAASNSKLAKFLTNPGPEHLDAANHCLQYSYHTRNLGIQYSLSGGGELTFQVPGEELHVFEVSAGSSYANPPDRRLAEG